MDCEVTPLLSVLRDGEFDTNERLRVEAHLEACAACRATIEAYRSIGSTAGDYAPASGPFDGRRALASVLARGRTPVWRRHVSVPAAVLPAVAVLAAGGVFLVLRPASPENTTIPAPKATGEILKYDHGRPPIIAVIPTILDHEDRP